MTINALMSEIEKLYNLQPQSDADDFMPFEKMRDKIEKVLITKGYNEESASDLIEDLLLLVESFSE